MNAHQMMEFKEQDLTALSQVLVPITVSEVLENDGFRFLRINKAHTDLSGLDAETFIGRNPKDLLPETEAHKVLQRDREAAQTGSPQTYEERLSLPGGQFWWRTSIAPIKDAQGVVRRL